MRKEKVYDVFVSILRIIPCLIGIFAILLFLSVVFSWSAIYDISIYAIFYLGAFLVMSLVLYVVLILWYDIQGSKKR